jgi:Peptidase S24-like
MTKKFTYNYRFSILIEQIRKSILSEEFTNEEFLDIVELTFGGYNSRQDIQLYIDRKKDLQKHQFDFFCDLLQCRGGFSVNEKFMDFGFGNPFDKITNQLPTNGKIIELWQKNLIITRYSAVASESTSVDAPPPILTNEKSWLNKIDAIIEVEGDSMADKIFDGDELFCNKLGNNPNFKNDKTIYVLEVRGYGNPMIKYVDYKKDSSIVTLISENQAHKPFTINLEDIVSVFEVIRVVKNPKNL